MANNKNKNKKNAPRRAPKSRGQLVKQSNAKNSKPTFAGEGGDIGARLGRLAGTVLGGVIGKIFGHGDYKINAPVSHNTIANASNIPQFGGGKGVNRVVHREYITDIVSSATALTFQNTSYPINPGLSTSFPWLCNIAENYTHYTVHGIIYEYRTMSADALNSTNTALGSVIMATNYDTTVPNFNGKRDMENSEFAMSCKPSQNMIHAIECDPATLPIQELYVRSGGVTTDLRFSDLGNFQIATTGVQGTSVVLGELWVSFDISFYKPCIPDTFGGSLSSQHVRRTSVAASSGIPTIQTLNVGTLEAFTQVSGTSGSMSWQAAQGSQFICTIYLSSAGVCAGSAASITAFNANTSPIIRYSGSQTKAPNNAYAAVNEAIFSFTIAPVVTGVIGFAVSAAMTWTVSVSADYFITQLDSSITS